MDLLSKINMIEQREFQSTEVSGKVHGSKQATLGGGVLL